MADQNLIGKEGEDIARDFLIEQGYVIYHTNWYWHHYELDIIATNGDELIIVEVKTRSDTYLISPENSIDSGKIKRIVDAADVYARCFRIDMPVRFDIITLVKKGNKYELDHIEDAFFAPIKRKW